MATAAELRAVEFVDRDTLLERCRNRVLREQITPSAAVDLELPYVTLDPESQAYFLRRGLIAAISDERHHAARGQKEMLDLWAPPRSRQRGFSAKELQVFLLGYEGADGAVKPLLEFDAADLAHLDDVCAAHARGWLTRRKAVKALREAMATEGVGRVQDLSQQRLRQLAPLFEEAWR